MSLVKKLIAYGYFSKEIPTEFQSERLADALDNINFDSLTKNVKEKWAKSISITIPKGNDFRRTISIPSPIHQILLCKLIEENWDELNDHFKISTISMTSPVISEKDNVAIESNTNINEKMHIRIKHLHNKKYILKTDISRYYPTIYTHIIPWALHTKEYAKKNIGKNRLLGNKIDKRIQIMQDGQTFGIPIGPITSQVISEIIGSAIDRDFRDLIGGEVHGFRYTDDIEYYFNSEELAKDALYKLQKVVSEYQLELNPTKTEIIKAPVEFEPEWKQYFTRFKFRRTVFGQLNDINAFFSNAFKYKHNFNDTGIIKYAIKKIRGEVIYQNNWSVFEALLLHAAFSDSNALPLVLEVIEGYSIKGYEINKLKLKEFVEELIKINMPQNNHYEVIWALVFAKRLNISLCSNISNLLLTADDSITCILTMILYNKNLLEGHLNFNKFKAYLNVEGLYGSNWLFTYEAYKQGWLKPYSDPTYVLEDPFFKILYENNVSFLRDEIDIQALIRLRLEESVTEEQVNTETEGSEGGEEQEDTETEEPEQGEEQEDTETEEPEQGEEQEDTETEEPEQGEEQEDTETDEPEQGEEQENTETEEPEQGEEQEDTETDEPEQGEEQENTETEEPEQREEQEEIETEGPEQEEELGILEQDLIDELFGDSIYKDNDWMFELLNTDFKKKRKIKSKLDDSDY